MSLCRANASLVSCDELERELAIELLEQPGWRTTLDDHTDSGTYTKKLNIDALLPGPTRSAIGMQADPISFIASGTSMSSTTSSASAGEVLQALSMRP